MVRPLWKSSSIDFEKKCNTYFVIDKVIIEINYPPKERFHSFCWKNKSVFRVIRQWQILKSYAVRDECPISIFTIRSTIQGFWLREVLILIDYSVHIPYYINELIDVYAAKTHYVQIAINIKHKWAWQYVHYRENRLRQVIHKKIKKQTVKWLVTLPCKPIHNKMRPMIIVCLITAALCQIIFGLIYIVSGWLWSKG